MLVGGAALRGRRASRLTLLTLAPREKNQGEHRKRSERRLGDAAFFHLSSSLETIREGPKNIAVEVVVRIVPHLIIWIHGYDDLRVLACEHSSEHALAVFHPSSDWGDLRNAIAFHCLFRAMRLDSFPRLTETQLPLPESGIPLFARPPGADATRVGFVSELGTVFKARHRRTQTGNPEAER